MGWSRQDSSEKWRITVIFPDMNHLATFGDDMNEAMEMAVDCLAGYIHSKKREGSELPSPSPVESVTPQSEGIDENDPDIARLFVSLVSVDVEEYARMHFNKAVKKTLSIPQCSMIWPLRKKSIFPNSCNLLSNENLALNRHNVCTRGC